MRVVSEEMLDRFRGAGKCEICLLWCNAREPHHCFAKGHGSGRRLDVSFNLIGLGSPQGAFRCVCHGLIHAGSISREEVLTVIAAREGMSIEDIESQVYLLRRAPKECVLCPRCGGRGGKYGAVPMPCGLCIGSGILNQFGEPWEAD